VANAFAEEYQKISVQLKTEPMKKASSYFNEQTKLLRDNVETAQAALQVPAGKGHRQPRQHRVDVESAAPERPVGQLVQAQGQSMEAFAPAHGEGSRASIRRTSPNPLIQNLKVGLGRPKRNSPTWASACRATTRNTWPPRPKSTSCAAT
jgi:succinoglycan biosynthesis transport protein ExoP